MDSIRLKLREDSFLVQDQAFFNEIRSRRFSDSQRYKVEKTNNAFRRRLSAEGVYAPKFWLDDNSLGVPSDTLILEFSVAKLLYGTNLREVSEADLPAIIQKLKAFLKLIGIGVFERELLHATIVLVAYAKNVPIDHLGKVSEILRVIAPFDYRPRSEFTRVEYRQGASTSALKYFNSSSHLTLYDKLGEILHEPVTQEERKIAHYLEGRASATVFQDLVRETLRVEFTLHNKVAVKQAMAKYYGRRNDYTLEEVFKDHIRDELLRNEVNRIFNHPLKEIVLLSVYGRDTFNAVINQYCKSFTQQAEIRFMLDVLLARGLKALRDEVLLKSTKRTWFRKQKKLKAVASKIELPQGITQLDNARVLEYLLSQFGIQLNLSAPKQLTLLG
jgi:hypothetical protein